MPNNTKKCAVIIVTYNSEAHIPKAMACLATQTYSPSQILLVDTGSSDPNYLNVYEGINNTKVRLAENGIGFCKGNNVGWSMVDHDTDYVFFLNPDAFLTPNFIEHAIAHMEAQPNCGALTGTTLGYDIKADKPTGKYDTTGIFRRWYGRWYDRGQGANVNSNLYSKVENIPAICGAVFFCRKIALDKVVLRGYEIFDSTFYMYKEDIDLSLRLKQKGWKLTFVPHLVSYHCRGWSADRTKVPRKMRLHSAANDLRVNRMLKSPLGVIYSSLKYSAVKLLDM